MEERQLLERMNKYEKYRSPTLGKRIKWKLEEKMQYSRTVCKC